MTPLAVVGVAEVYEEQQKEEQQSCEHLVKDKYNLLLMLFICTYDYNSVSIVIIIIANVKFQSIIKGNPQQNHAVVKI